MPSLSASFCTISAVVVQRPQPGPRTLMSFMDLLRRSLEQGVEKEADRENDATCAIYRTDLPDQPAACFVYRQWRLGWFLQQAKGPRNIDLEPQQLAQTYSVF